MREPIIKFIVIPNIIDFLSALYKIDSEYNRLLTGFVFRGESTSKYALFPSILRSETREKWLKSKYNYFRGNPQAKEDPLNKLHSSL